MAGAAWSGSVFRDSTGGDGAGVQFGDVQRVRAGDLCVRVLRDGAVRRDGEVRVGDRMAVIHATGGPGGDCVSLRWTGIFEAGGDGVQYVRCAFGACVSGWSAAERAAVLHECGGAEEDGRACVTEAAETVRRDIKEKTPTEKRHPSSVGRAADS